jgi:hypothetical protein
MLLQSLLTIVIMVLVAGGIMVSSLAAAKSAIHEATTRSVGLALDRGTGVFTSWAATFVRANTASGSWPTIEQTAPVEPMCATVSPSVACKSFATIAYRVTGSSTGAATKPATGSEALNLQTLVDEQRIGAEITATVTNDAGAVLGSGTRDITVRVFDEPPWAIVTGTRNATSVLGSEQAAEGDTAGTEIVDALGKPEIEASPDPKTPADFKDTVINVTMSCTNSAGNNDPAHPEQDDHAPGNGGLPWGVQRSGRAYEAPCTPAYPLAANPGVPADADMPIDGEYRVGAFGPPRGWNSGTAKPGGWPQ